MDQQWHDQQVFANWLLADSPPDLVFVMGKGEDHAGPLRRCPIEEIISRLEGDPTMLPGYVATALGMDEHTTWGEVALLASAERDLAGRPSHRDGETT